MLFEGRLQVNLSYEKRVEVDCIPYEQSYGMHADERPNDHRQRGGGGRGGGMKRFCSA